MPKRDAAAEAVADDIKSLLDRSVAHATSLGLENDKALMKEFARIRNETNRATTRARLVKISQGLSRRLAELIAKHHGIHLAKG